MKPSTTRNFSGVLLALLVIAIVGCVVHSRTTRSSDSALTTRLDESIAREVPIGFSGAVLIAKGDEILLNRGYGALRGVPMRADSRFWIASAGKQFTSAAILKCAERGLLNLEEPMSRFIPDAPADKRTITVKQLLAHLSGLGQSYVSEGSTSRDDAVHRILSEPLVDQPGNTFHYSNNNYQLAVAIVEIVSGNDYRDFLRRELLDPAGLHDTGFNATPGAKRVVPAREEMPTRLQRESWGGQGEYSTTRDLFRWYRILQARSLLNEDSVRSLFTPVTPIHEGEAALGWFSGRSKAGTTRIFTRGNEDWGPNALLYAYPDDDVVIVILSHAGNTEHDVSWTRDLHAKLEDILFHAE